MSIAVEESLMSEEPLLVQVWSKRTPPFPDRLIGESRARLSALVSNTGRMTPMTFELGRPGHHQQGLLSCSLALEQQAASDHAETHVVEVPSENDESKSQAGAIGLAVTTNHEAELASAACSLTTLAETQRRKQLLNRGDIAEIGEISNQEDLGIRPVDVRADDDMGNCGIQNSALRAKMAKRSNTRGVQSGIDIATGLLWRKDARGHRRFFLGFLD